MVMRQRIPLILALLLCGCTVLEGTPEPPPPLTDKPQEIRRNQTQGLQKIGSVSVLVRGAPVGCRSGHQSESGGGQCGLLRHYPGG
ncbi:putative biofilm stress and motility protein A [Pluralibacter gergoviae]|nr:putative biofilm stress and motility protein A [Pluralibacter gergoviae]